MAPMKSCLFNVMQTYRFKTQRIRSRVVLHGWAPI